MRLWPRRPDIAWCLVTVSIYRYSPLWSWYFRGFLPNDPREYRAQGYTWTRRGALRTVGRIIRDGIGTEGTRDKDHTPWEWTRRPGGSVGGEASHDGTQAVQDDAVDK